MNTARSDADPEPDPESASAAPESVRSAPAVRVRRYDRRDVDEQRSHRSDVSADDTDIGWGETRDSGDQREAWLQNERPPHHE